VPCDRWTRLRPVPPERDAFGRPIPPPAEHHRELSTSPDDVDAQPAGSEIEALRQLLAAGLASEELTSAAEQDPVALGQLQEVQRLMDLHARGSIDDAALEAAIAALLPS